MNGQDSAAKMLPTVDGRTDAALVIPPARPFPAVPGLLLAGVGLPLRPSSQRAQL
jgi:hypothetical protein